MISILIFGIILFILGVGATIVYDKAKEQQAQRATRPVVPKKVSQNRTMQDIHEEFLDKFKQQTSAKQPKKRSQYTSRKKETLDPKDFSTQSDLTVEELMEKIKRMNKK